MNPSTTERYREMLAGSALNEVAFGPCTVRLVDADELSNAQVGYAVDRTGEPLAVESEGGWRSEWLVVGHEDLTGDPLFLDTSDEEWPVYTAMHGEGAWDPTQIGDSFRSFLDALELIRRAGIGRENPVALEANPLSTGDAKRILAEIHRKNPKSPLDFWTFWLTET